MLLGLAVLPFGSAAVAQSPSGVRRIGVLVPAEAQWERHPFIDELQKLGFRESSNLVLAVRSAEGDLRRLPALAQALAGDDVEVIVAANTPAAQAALAAGGSVPIVIGIVADPVVLGFVPSLSRPGGRVTGVANMAGEIAPKRLQILKEALPGARRVACLYHPDEPIVRQQMIDLPPAAAALSLALTFLPVRSAADLDAAMQQAVHGQCDAVFRLAGQGITLEARMSLLGLQHRLPVMALTASGVRQGALLSYFAGHTALWRRAAHQAARILTGERPGDLPFERPDRFELAVNLRTAAALGLAIPAAILARADEVVE